MRRKPCVVAEALPELRRAVGREVDVEYLPPRSDRRRARPVAAPAPEREWGYEHLIAFEPCWIQGCRGPKDRRVVDVVTPPIEVAFARITRIVVPSRCAPSLVIETIDVGNESVLRTHDAFGPTPALIFGLGGPRINHPVHVGTRIRMRIRNIGRRKVWFQGAVLVEEAAAAPPHLELNGYPPALPRTLADPTLFGIRPVRHAASLGVPAAAEAGS